MDYDALLPILQETEPIAYRRGLLIKRYVEDFRRLAAKWRGMPARDVREESLQEFRDLCELLDASGRLVIAAHVAGVLPDVGGLHAYVAWNAADDAHDPRDVEARLVRCPANLFEAACGGILRSVMIDENGGRIIGQRYGGLAPRLDRGVLALSRTQQYAATCELLADLIEISFTRGKDESASSDGDGKPGVDPPSFEEFPPMQFVDENGICEFGLRVIPWAVFRALYKARAKLTAAALQERVPSWKEAVLSHGTIKQAMADARSVLREQKRGELACRLKTAGGFYWFDRQVGTSC